MAARKTKATAVAVAAPTSARRTPPRQTGPSRAQMFGLYESAVGKPAFPRATKKWMAAEVASAQSARRMAIGMTGLSVASVSIAAVGAYNRSREEGNHVAGSIARGAVAAAPGLALSQISFISAGISGHKIPGAAVISKVANRAILPALAVLSAHTGALEDHQSAVRGAVRGLVRAVDPTSLFLSRGLVERGYNVAFGGVPVVPDRSGSLWRDNTPAPMNSYARALHSLKPTADKVTNWRFKFLQEQLGGKPAPAPLTPPGQWLRNKLFGPAAYLDSGAAKRDVVATPAPIAPVRRLAAPTHVYKDAWTDSRGRAYARQNYTVRTAA